MGWLNANGVAVQAIATVVLVGVTAVYVALTRRIANAARDQANHLVEATRSSRRAVVAALLEEVRRIRSELGPRPDEDALVAVVGGAVPPQVHRWFHPVIPQVAASDASIVGLFLALDRDLHNHRVELRRLHHARRELAEKQRTAELYERTYASTSVEPEEITAWAEARRNVEVAEDNEQRALGHATVTYNGCHRTLDRLEEALGTSLATLRGAA